MSPGRTATRPPPRRRAETAGRGPAPRGAATRAASKPSIDPRIRARRRQVVRGRTRRRRLVVVSLVVLTVLTVGALLLLHSPVFGARVVTVKGSVHTPPAEVIAVAGLAGHPPLIDMDPGQSAARLERLPWIRTATVNRQWPDGVSVTITERVPVAVVATAGGRWLVVDAEGRVVETVASAPAGLVHLSLTGHPSGAPGWLSRQAAPALAVAATLPKAFVGQVDQVATGRQGNVTLTLDQSLTVSVGPPVDLKQKYEDVAAILAGATLHPGDVIDVTVPGAPAVGPNA